MLKKIILPLVLLIFAQQNFYGMEEGGNNIILDTNIRIKVDSIDEQRGKWICRNYWINRDESNEKKYPKLWLLLAIVDNVPFQYGGSKIWKHGEAYYGLSNGIGFFPSFLNFGWLKIGFVDAHINVINLILDYFKNFIYLKSKKNKSKKNFDILVFLLPPICVNLFSNIHIFSVKILNCIKIKLVAPLTLYIDGYVGVRGAEESTQWYITYNENNQISWWYALLSPRIEINIPGLIN